MLDVDGVVGDKTVGDQNDPEEEEEEPHGQTDIELHKRFRG